MAQIDKRIPQVGMRFKDSNEAWMFWVEYGGHIGFDVRKRCTNKSKFDGKVTSCRFVCSNEGLRRKCQTEREPKRFRAETRTDCLVRMVITLDRATENYEITEVVLEHNHYLQLPQTRHLLVSQRKISELQAFEIETADDSGIMPKPAHEFACRKVGGPLNLGYTCRDQKNHLRSKRQRELAFGQAGSMLKYFRDKVAENPSFQYALQLDCEENIANIFWLDAKMLLDYAHFGDVTFDTTFGTNKEYRPFGIFLGLNQFRETTIFGAALMFDETRDSFIWLFESFLAAHNGRQPRTIYTDQDIAMGKAIEHVFTQSYHGLCTFHIMQNAVKHLSSVKDEEEDEVEDEEKETHILTDFGACMYGYEDKAEFEEAFDNMRQKVHKQTWLDSIYKVKEKWAECYMRDVFSLGVRSTQLSESFNIALKNHLKSDFHIVRFLMHFERTMEVKRRKELESEFEARKKLPRIKMFTPMLVQASKVYTPIIFEAFQGEYERSMAACCRVLDGNNKFGVAIGSLHDDLQFEEERIVIGDPLTQTISCSCGMFNRAGVLCGHGLKVLDLLNIKTMPTHYVLKRLTREARNGSIQDRQGRNVVENPKLEAQLRYQDLSHKFHNLAHKAANYLECCVLLENAHDSVAPQIEDKLNATTSAMNEPCKDKENVEPNVQQTNEFLCSAQLKKKEVQSRNLRRKKGWLEKLLKGKRKSTKTTAPTKKGAKQQKKGKPQVEVEKDDKNKGANLEFQECNAIFSFTQLLTTPPCDVHHLF
ncbi:protein FAR1-RELATED SEQUENCE 5 isoform X2 [Triticum aestivum]|uniref:protein FAR1-RELATED SEQUENCE 5 isoform X2 n=1 Tax=Triticum aestivum TaxID=4565 RepID=UPI001D01E6AF|nr:protein FAR1-RELATED SEQUENCE 5-like isoform X2 [Triticum aestivum]